MKTCTAAVPTEHASQYLRQLCRHWSHRFEVEFDDVHGRIQMPDTVCLLRANPTALNVELQMQDGVDVNRVQEVVAEHLQRFGFKETLQFDWKSSAE